MVSVHDDRAYGAIYEEMLPRYRDARVRWEIPDELVR